MSQKDLDRLERQAKSNKMEFNQDKYKAIITTTTKRNKKKPSIQVQAEGAVA